MEGPRKWIVNHYFRVLYALLLDVGIAAYFLLWFFFWSGLFFCLIAHDLFVTTLAPY